MKILKFEDIIAWQKSQDLAVELYSIFSDCKDFGFKNQICNAVVSISNNIAEGFDRSSNLDFSRFLYFAIASCSEVRSMLYIAKRLNYIDELICNKLIENTNEISKIISGLISSLKKTSKKPLTTNH